MSSNGKLSPLLSSLTLFRWSYTHKEAVWSLWFGIPFHNFRKKKSHSKSNIVDNYVSFIVFILVLKQSICILYLCDRFLAALYLISGLMMASFTCLLFPWHYFCSSSEVSSAKELSEQYGKHSIQSLERWW